MIDFEFDNLEPLQLPTTSLTVHTIEYQPRLIIINQQAATMNHHETSCSGPLTIIPVIFHIPSSTVRL